MKTLGARNVGRFLVLMAHSCQAMLMVVTLASEIRRVGYGFDVGMMQAPVPH